MMEEFSAPCYTRPIKLCFIQEIEGATKVEIQYIGSPAKNSKKSKYIQMAGYFIWVTLSTYNGGRQSMQRHLINYLVLYLWTDV